MHSAHCAGKLNKTVEDIAAREWPLSDNIFTMWQTEDQNVYQQRTSVCLEELYIPPVNMEIQKQWFAVS